MKTVVISGYYGYENIGDEALLASIVSALKAEIPDLRITVLSANPRQTADRYGVEAVNRFSLFAVFTALRRADLLISGGGSLLQDVTGPLTIPYYLSIVALARMLGKPVMFYAQGIGPVSRGFGRMLIRLIADRVDAITLRDPASGELLKEIGVHNPAVELTADPVFGIDAGSLAGLAEVCTELGIVRPAGPLAGIFVREWQGLTGYKEAVARAADLLVDDGWQVVFVPMQYPGDTAPAREIAGMMRNRPHLVERGLGLRQIMGLVGSMDLVVGMRLHALIIATVCGVPMVGISYDPKVTEFLDMIGQPVIRDLKMLTPELLLERVGQIKDNSEEIRRKLHKVKADLRQKALRNSQIAAEILKRAAD